jgi:hypothetical protein
MVRADTNQGMGNYLTQSQHQKNPFWRKYKSQGLSSVATCALFAKHNKHKYHPHISALLILALVYE